MGDSDLASFIENKLLPELNKRKLKWTSYAYYLSALRSGQIIGAHSWNNLATLIKTYCYLCGLNCPVMSYCEKRALTYL